MLRTVIISVLLFLLATPLCAEEVSVELRFDATPQHAVSDKILSAVKGFRGVRILPFTDRRSSAESYLGESRSNGTLQKISSKTSVAVYATDAFKKIYTEWGGKVSPDGPLVLKGEITQFTFDENDGYQAKIGFHFYLLDSSDRILWDGHSSGIVKGAGKTIGAENISSLLNDILRATYGEILEDDKLVGVWSGRISSTYVIRSSDASAKNIR